MINNRIISSSNGLEITGSIYKIQCIVNNSVLTHANFGNPFENPQTQSFESKGKLAAVTLPNGTSIEGNFVNCKTGAGGFLIYLREA